MKSRISAYSNDVEQIYEVLFYGEDVTDDERNFALIALLSIVGNLQSDVEKLQKQVSELSQNTKHS